jgi:putative ABC transport system permease protein
LKAPRTSRKWAQTIIAAEIAVSLVLLTGAGTLMSGVLRLGSERLGFVPGGVITVEVTWPQERHRDPESRAGFLRAVVDQVSSVPGVQAAAIGSAPPWDPNQNWFEEWVEVRGRAVDPGLRVFDVQSEVVGPRMLEVMQTRLLRGRDFNEQDALPDAPPVVMISQRLVDEYFGGADPVGRQIRFGQEEFVSEWSTVIGVVETWRHLVDRSAWQETPVIFRPRAGFVTQGFQSLAVRISSDPGLVQMQLRERIRSLEPNAQVKTEMLEDRLAHFLLYTRFRAGLVGCFGGAALLLAGIGLYGVLAQLVAQRTPEFGIRRAVGAQTAHVALLVLRHGGSAVIAGIGVGLPGGLAFARVVQSLVHGTSAADTSLFGLAALGVIVSSAIAATVPLWRAIRVDPIVALRHE